MKLDLHIHSTTSDGTLPPAEVVRRAAKGGLDVIALADHDTIAGVPAAVEAAQQLPIQVIPAIEASSSRIGYDIHILGYFVDTESPELTIFRERALNQRRDRMQEMVDRLCEGGVTVTMEDVVSAAGAGVVTLGRPHLARALVVRGHVSVLPEAFDKFIGDEHPAFVPSGLADPIEVLQMIEDAGGISVWAHPPTRILSDLLPEFVDAGLRGLEVYRPRSRPPLVQKLKQAAQNHGLLVSGGSDWHGPEGGSKLGDFYVPSDDVSGLLEAGGF